MLTKEQEQRQAIEMLCTDMLVPQDHLLRKMDAAVDFKHWTAPREQTEKQEPVVEIRGITRPYS